MEYEYLCSNCGYDFDEKQSIHDEALVKCPKCKKKTLSRVFHVPYVINSEPRTMGGLADRNRQKMGRYEFQDREANKPKPENLLEQKLPNGAQIVKRPNKGKAPWWRPGTTKPLDLKKIKNQKKYIEEGKIE